MSENNRPVVITGNWKMYKTTQDSKNYIKELIPHLNSISSKVYLAVPFTAISSAVKAANGSSLIIGAQNMHDVSEGAFTGEIAGKMLVDSGAKFVLLGHSERRRYFNETNQFINRKVKRALKEKLQPVLCIGETLEQKQTGQAVEILTQQLSEGLAGLKFDELDSLMLAYEPVWAVGTDEPATPEMAQEMHHFIRNWISSNFSEDVGKNIIIQYGGSVKPDNAGSLLEQPDIDGLLVGGASLSVQTFSEIIKGKI